MHPIMPHIQGVHRFLISTVAFAEYQICSAMTRQGSAWQCWGGMPLRCRVVRHLRHAYIKLLVWRSE
jgi:hypothetical protein